jgi:hypothetical protein
MLAKGVEKHDAGEVFKDLAIITFNHDRCVEALLFHALQPTFGITARQAAEIMKTLRLYRPYGGLGKVKFLRGDEPPYGLDRKDLRFFDLSQIQLYTEDMGERPDLVAMRQTLAQAKNVVFLGFGFIPKNMGLLNVSGEPNRNKVHIYATTVKERDPKREAIQRQIENTIGALSPCIHRGGPEDSCLTLLRDYSHALSA